MVMTSFIPTSSSDLFKAFDVEGVDGSATDFCLDHHRLDFKQGGLDVGWHIAPAGVAALADEFQYLG
jgi:hypothetical protein